MLSTGEEIRSPQRSSRSGPILAKMPCTIRAYRLQKERKKEIFKFFILQIKLISLSSNHCIGML